jgi:hypothetical protein
MSNHDFNPHSFTAGAGGLIATGAFALVEGLASAAAQVRNGANAAIVADGIQHLADRGNELVDDNGALRAENTRLANENACLQAALTTAKLQLSGVSRDLARYFRARGIV